MNKIAIFEKVSFEEWKNRVDEYNIEKYNNIKLPVRATVGSAGYDFFAPFSFNLSPKQTIIIPTGIRCKIEEGWFLMCAPRSGLGFKYRLQLDNTIGIIDSDYYNSDNEGHIMIKITNDTYHNKTLEISVGESFAQGIFLPYGITQNDMVTDIRNGGFGSTSK